MMNSHELPAVKILEKKDVPYRIIRLSEKAVSASDVVKYAKDPLNPKEVCKTIVVQDAHGAYFAILLRADARVDFEKVKKIIGSTASLVRADALKSVAGKEPGAICPFLLDIPLYVDAHVFLTSLINFGSGDHLFGIEIASNDLQRLISFVVVDVAKTP